MDWETRFAELQDSYSRDNPLIQDIHINGALGAQDHCLTIITSLTCCRCLRSFRLKVFPGALGVFNGVFGRVFNRVFDELCDM